MLCKLDQFERLEHLLQAGCRQKKEERGGGRGRGGKGGREGRGGGREGRVH
jgi:hypothetical protein